MSSGRRTLTLKPQIGRRVERGHLWVFSNEVADLTGDPQPGDEVIVRSAKGRFLGMALFSASSLIRARIYSRTMDEPCDAAYLRRALERARQWRARLLPGWPAVSHRLVHGDADGLPGLVVDVYGDPRAPHVVLQITTAALERRREELLAALIELLHPTAIIERSDVAVRELEGLEPLKRVLHGTPASPCAVHEPGAELLADLLEGQKTGYFLDQVGNRRQARAAFNGARVLDMFCYVGAWSVTAGVAGATRVLGVDSSQGALDLARAAVELPANAIPAGRCDFERADAFQFMAAAAERGDLYDVVIVDPPALAKSRKDAEAALRAYRELNRRALQVLEPGGLLIACSCSHHVSSEQFETQLQLAARDTHSDLLLEWRGGQHADHPVHLATPETAYLKCLFLRKR